MFDDFKEGEVSDSVVRLRLVSIAETISFAVLLAAMFLRSEAGVSIVGMIHGLLFLAYAYLVVVDRQAFGWSTRFVVLAILTGPVGAIVVLERLRHLRGPADQGADGGAQPGRVGG
jgi:integral membrane protein